MDGGASGAGAGGGYVPDASLATDHPVAGQQYDSFTNCLDDAFANAARTLAARQQAHGAQSAEVMEWARGQDAVFSNCGDGKPATYYGPGKPPAPPPAPHLPAAVAASAPVWLQQDRAYQLAAARFYQLDFAGAEAAFRAIAADHASPWSPLAGYLVARVLLRKASLMPAPNEQCSQNCTLPTDAAAVAKYRADQQAQQLRYQQQVQQAYGAAAQQLHALQGDPREAALQPAIASLLDFTELRANPAQQAEVLAARLQSKQAPQFEQALIDLTWLRTSQPDPTVHYTAATPGAQRSEMLQWIDDVSTLDDAPNPYTGEASARAPQEQVVAAADALRHWRERPSAAWLLAALMLAQPKDAAAPELLRAAAAVPPSDPGYAAITYHRLRLMPGDAATRAQLLALLPRLEHTDSASAQNLFAALSARSAPTLATWLAAAPRRVAGWEGEEGESTPDCVAGSVDHEVESNCAQQKIEDICGTAMKAQPPLFDLDAATMLNRDLPLRLLAEAAESPALAPNLRYQVAQAAWARALLLDSSGTDAGLEAIARRMAPKLVACRAAWKPVVDAYAAAATPTDRRATALLALMRFASTEPSVRQGEERREGFATYDVFRQNWWCSVVPPPGQTVDSVADVPLPTVQLPPPPQFLTAADLAEAHAQVAQLQKIPSASSYFALQALAWQREHPADARTAEILGEAFRVLRNGCRNDPPYDEKTGLQTTNPHDMRYTSNLEHAVFDVLHTQYAESVWAKRYKSWE